MGDSDVPESVKKCVAILRSVDNDTDKLSALFLATNLVKGDECNDKVKELLFKSIGVDFLKRMLSSSSSFSQDCPPLICRSLAMSMFTTFCSVPELAKSPEMLAQIPVFLEIIIEIDEDDELIMVSDAYECLKWFSLFEEGKKALINEGAIEKLIEVYSQQCFQCDEALNILIVLVQSAGSKAWEKHDASFFNNFLTKVASDFSTDHTEHKFELCTVIYHLVSSVQGTPIAETISEERWHALIYKGINDILTSKIGKQQREPALNLAAAMVQTLGMIWTTQDSEKPKQFFLLLTHLSAIEIRMQLEDRTIEQILKNLGLIVSCFLIVEASVTSMSNELVELDSKEKQQMYTALKGAFSAIIGTLKKIQTKNSKGPLEEMDKVLTVALIRALAAWMAQETTSMRAVLHEILPFILSITNESFYSYRSSYISKKVKSSESNDAMTDLSKEDPDLLKIMLPSLCHFTIEEKGRQIMLESKEDEVLLECFSFHWSIVNYKKPPVPKSERLKVGRSAVELPENIKEAMKESRVALINMCNIFMNIIVVDSKFIESSPTFTSLLKFVLNNLTELKDIPENLVLYANMSVLGLMLLRHKSKTVSKTDFSICRYIQCTIRFLWDAYNVDESDHVSSLVVSMAYKKYWIEIMEMWFLGMQTMSIVLSLIPWISEFIMETGWAQGILEMLKRARPGSMPHNTKAAYEDLLCQLVKTNSSVISVFKENDALTVCRNHMFLELGKLLFGD